VADVVIGVGFGAPFGIAGRLLLHITHAVLYLCYMGQYGRRRRIARCFGGFDAARGLVDVMLNDKYCKGIKSFRSTCMDQKPIGRAAMMSSNTVNCVFQNIPLCI